MNEIKQFPTNEAGITHYVNTFKNEILSGNEDPLNALKHLKIVEKTISQLLKDSELEEHFLLEAEKYGKSFTHLDVKFSIKEVGVRYDFAICNDSIWNGLNEQKKAIELKMKEREAFLKVIPFDGMASPQTGEMIYPASKQSTTKVTTSI